MLFVPGQKAPRRTSGASYVSRFSLTNRGLYFWIGITQEGRTFRECVSLEFKVGALRSVLAGTAGAVARTWHLNTNRFRQVTYRTCDEVARGPAEIDPSTQTDPIPIRTSIADKMLMFTFRSGLTAAVEKIVIGVVALSIAGGFPCALGQSAVEVAATSTRGLDLSQPLTVAWRYDSGLTLNLTPASDNGRVYLPLAGGTIVSLKAADGTLNWRAEMGGELSASPMADDSRVYVASETGKSASGSRHATGALRALGREGGVTQWMRTLAMPLRGSLTLSDEKLFANSDDGKVYAVAANTGEMIWTYDYGSPFKGQPAVSEGRVYIGSEDGNVLALDAGSGKLLWRFKTKGPVRGPVAQGRGVIFFGSGDGYVYAVNAQTGQLLWRKRAGAAVQAVVRAGEDLLAASLDNFVYKFSPTGTRLWKRQLPGRISSQPLLVGEGALFTPLSSALGVVLELRDGRQVNSLPVGGEITSSASSIAVGDTVLLTSEGGLVAFRQPREPQPQKSN